MSRARKRKAAKSEMERTGVWRDEVLLEAARTQIESLEKRVAELEEELRREKLGAAIQASVFFDPK